MTWDAIVVGAGHNGLAAALHLCSALAIGFYASDVTGGQFTGMTT